jgi:hypothetical protein
MNERIHSEADKLQLKNRMMSDVKHFADEERNAPIRAYTSVELQQLYRIPRHTWYRWMKKHAEAIGPREGHFYTMKQVRIIFELLDPPPALES